ncbi:T6SS immunity protein Tli4 family protein [Photorhabdus sp. CRCIA-P01]|uniref:T6SS immunity protein Tli4 family protein n=1 Tax=Photorhabdus sp. CRCIA-P01 TaxID=2019570 RepID=UPI000E59EADB|nr:T6SS immunity protein Tli4 family protein [Photorhabdus sp. CRCIA-P01]
MNRKKVLVIAIASLLVLVSYGLWHRLQPYPPHTVLNQKEQLAVDKLLANLQTRCIGRYLVDLPANYNNTLNDAIWVNDNLVETGLLYPPAFEQRIQLREDALRQMKTSYPVDMPYLKNIYRLPQGMQGIIFERMEDQSVPDMARVLEAHLYSNGVAIKVEMKATNASAARYDKDRQIHPDIYNNDVPAKLAELKDLLSRIQGRKETEIPTTAGSCIPHAFIADNKKDKEFIELLYKTNPNNYLNATMMSNNYIREKDSMLERLGVIETMLSRGKVFRKGKRKINGLDTEELLLSGRQPNNDNPRYLFTLLVNEKTGGKKTPVFDLTVVNDEETPTAYTQNEIVAFWDAISQTLRVRPGAFK